MDAADGRDDGRGAGAEHLDELALVVRLHNLLHGDLALGDLKLAPLGDELDDGPAGHAGQDDALVEGRGHELLAAVAVIEEGEDVHGADLGDLVVLAEEPDHLLATQLLGLFLREGKEASFLSMNQRHNAKYMHGGIKLRKHLGSRWDALRKILTVSRLGKLLALRQEYFKFRFSLIISRQKRENEREDNFGSTELTPIQRVGA